jgi:hypothetical protein
MIEVALSKVKSNSSEFMEKAGKEKAIVTIRGQGWCKGYFEMFKLNRTPWALAKRTALSFPRLFGKEI